MLSEIKCNIVQIKEEEGEGGGGGREGEEGEEGKGGEEEEEEEAAAAKNRIGLDQGQKRIAVIFNLGT